MRSLGVDHILFTPNPGVYRKLYRLGFETTGDMCYPCHRGIFTVPVRTAVDMRIPLIVWGENPVAEYGGPAADADNPYLDRRYMELYSGVKEVGIEEFLKYGFTEFELRPWVYPSDEEIKKVGVTGVFLGYYIEWNTDRQLETVTKLGFRGLEKDERRETTYNTFRHVDCKYFDLHYYIMYLKFGYSRATQDVAIDIRDGKLAKEAGMKLIERFEGNFPERYFRDFLEFTGMTEEEFWKTAEGWRGRDTKGPTDAWRKDKKGVWVLNDETVFSIRK
jgi:N-acetyl sugar amidotransferase